MNTTDGRDVLFSAIKSFDMAMLATRGASLHAQPLPVAEVADDNTVVMVGAFDSVRVYELETDPRGLVTFQGGGRSISSIGVVRIEQNSAELRRLWSPALAAWFPLGIDDPSLHLLRFEISHAILWDVSAAPGDRLVFEVGRGPAAGVPPVVAPPLRAVIAF